MCDLIYFTHAHEPPPPCVLYVTMMENRITLQCLREEWACMSLYVSLFVLNDNTKVDGDILVQSRESSCQVMKIIQLANYTSECLVLAWTQPCVVLVSSWSHSTGSYSMLTRGPLAMVLVLVLGLESKVFLNPILPSTTVYRVAKWKMCKLYEIWSWMNIFSEQFCKRWFL